MQWTINYAIGLVDTRVDGNVTNLIQSNPSKTI